MNSELVVRLKGVSKRLGKLSVGPMDLEIEAGYVIAIVGPNGSGKTSLFRLLMNVLKPDTGELRILDGNYTDAEVAIKQRVGYVPEQTEWNEMDCSTIQELTRFISRWYSNWNEEKYQALLQRYELEGKLKLSTLSKGMQRKLAFIHAMAYDPDLLLLDEPTSGLDPFAWRLMMEDIVQFMDRGSKTVLFATHILDEVKRMADYVAFIYEGKLLGFYEKDTLLSSWKSFWVDRHEQLSLLPGVMAVEESTASVRVVGNMPMETESALQRHGIKLMSAGAIELDEILACLIRKNRVGTFK